MYPLTGSTSGELAADTVGAMPTRVSLVPTNPDDHVPATSGAARLIVGCVGLRAARVGDRVDPEHTVRDACQGTAGHP